MSLGRAFYDRPTLDVARDLEWDSGALRHINGNMGPFQRSYAADEAEVRLFVLDQFVLCQINAMMDRVSLGHGFLFTLSITDADVLDVGIEAIKFTQLGFMRPMQRQDYGAFDEP